VSELIRRMNQKEFNEILKDTLPEQFIRMKESLGDKRYDILSIISGTLLSDAIIFMKKIGILEEFQEDKNEISHMLIKGILENRKEK